MRRLKLAILFFVLLFIFTALNVFTFGTASHDGDLIFAGWPYECLGYYSTEGTQKLRQVDWDNLRTNSIVCFIFAVVITNLAGYCFPRKSFFDRIDDQERPRRWQT